MLFQWGIRSLKAESRGLGYPTICPMLREGIPVRASSFEPTGYCDADFRELQAAIDNLDRKYQLVLIRAYRPWQAQAVEVELSAYEVTERTWRNWLHDAALMICGSMSRVAA